MKRLILLLLCCPALAFGYTVVGFNVTTDGSQADTQSAFTYVDGLNADGYTIIIGTAGGSYTWTSGVAFASTMVHQVTITSAGGAANKTTITFDFDDTGTGLTLRAADNKLERLTGFIFTTAAGRTLGTGAVSIQTTGSGTARNAYRIDHCNFVQCTNQAIYVLFPNTSGGTIYGCIDNCAFTTTTSHGGIYFFSGNDGNNWTTGGTTNGDMTWGTYDTNIVETCTFTNTGAIVPGFPAIDASYNGVRYCARYNQFTDWVCVCHGSDSAPTSTLQTEIYNNTTTVTGGCDYAWYIRGGSTVAFNNTITYTGSGFYNSGFKLTNDSSGSSYPYFQQIGQGVSSGSSFTQGSYFYSNTYNLNGGSSVTTNGAHSADIVLNRDYFTAAPNGGTPLTSYTAAAYPRYNDGATYTSGVSGKAALSGKFKLN